MRRIPLLATVALIAPVVLVGPAGSSPDPRSAARPASYAFLKAQVFAAPGLCSIAVGMPNEKVVKVQRLEADGTWTRPTVLFRKQGVTCGEIDGRASAGGVALTLECDTPYYEDTAPVHSMGFVTRDLSTWVGKRIPGESYQDPAISTTGQYAAWLSGGEVGDHTVNSAATGWSQGASSFDYDSGGEGIVVDDAGTVTIIGPESTDDGRCVLSVHDVALGGPEDSYVLDGVDPGCTEGMIDNVDDHTVVGGYNRESRFTVTREPSQRWAVTRRAPADEPSLVIYGGPRKQVIRNVFSDAAGQALVSLGGPDKGHLYAQVYDDGTGTWGPTQLVHAQSRGRCRTQPTYFFEPLPRMHAVHLRCAGSVVLLTSPDSSTWTGTRLDARPFAVSGNGALLAAPGPRSTTVVSPAGTTRLPVNAPGRCDFVFPIAANAVVRLHGGAGSRWPTRLQKSVDGERWRTIQTVRMPSHGACQRVRSQTYETPTTFFMRGDQGTYVSLTVRPGGRGGWHVAPVSY